MVKKKSFKVVSVLVAMILSISVSWASSSTDLYYGNNILQTQDYFKLMGVNTQINLKSNDPMTREEGMLILVDLFGFTDQVKAMTDEEVNKQLAIFIDNASIAPEARAAVAYSTLNGWVKGFPGGTFEPKFPLTSQAYATLILRYLGHTPDYNKAISDFGSRAGLTDNETSIYGNKKMNYNDVYKMSKESLNCDDAKGTKFLNHLVNIKEIEPQNAKLFGYDDSQTSQGQKPITNMYTESFLLSPLSSDWTWSSAKSTWALDTTEGVIKETSGSAIAADPKKLILNRSGFSQYQATDNHLVLAKLRIDEWVDGNGARAGVSLLNNPEGAGYSLVLFKEGTGNKVMMFIHDGVALGTKVNFDWSEKTWYWMKLVNENGVLKGKVWKDGEAEPEVQIMQAWTGLTGSVGLVSGSAGSLGGHAKVSFDDVTVYLLSEGPEQ